MRKARGADGRQTRFCNAGTESIGRNHVRAQNLVRVRGVDVARHVERVVGVVAVDGKLTFHWSEDSAFKDTGIGHARSCGGGIFNFDNLPNTGVRDDFARKGSRGGRVPRLGADQSEGGGLGHRLQINGPVVLRGEFFCPVVWRQSFPLLASSIRRNFDTVGTIDPSSATGLDHTQGKSNLARGARGGDVANVGRIGQGLTKNFGK